MVKPLRSGPLLGLNHTRSYQSVLNPWSLQKASSLPPLFPSSFLTRTMATATSLESGTMSNGDLNNTGAMRVSQKVEIDPASTHCTLASTVEEDEEEVRDRYRPFILKPAIQSTDWVSRLELATVTKLCIGEFAQNW